MSDVAKNFAGSTVSVAPIPATSGTALTVATGEGVRFPAVPFSATVWPVNTIPTPETAEIVRVTAIAGDVLTIERAQESTTAREIIAGDLLAQTLTAAAWNATPQLDSTPTWTAAHTWSQSLPANTAGAAQSLVNPAAATSGNQRFSPATQWEGFGWDTAAGASRSFRVQSFVQPVESSALDNSKFLWQTSMNSGAWSDALSFKPAGAGGTLEGNSWDVFNFTVNGTMLTSAIEGLFSLGMIDNGGGLFSYTFAFVDSVGATAPHNFIIDPQDGDRTLGLSADWSFGTYTGTAPTATGKLTVTVAGQLYEIPARLVP